MSETHEHRPTILIADDNPQLLELLEAYLEPIGADVVTAPDGLAALSLVEQRLPDLILLDVMMPKRSGFDVCRHLSNDERFRHIPVILVTALNEMGDKERGRECGAREFLSKPVNKLDLLDRVRNLLPQPNAPA
jgi:two-component system, OmpR family, alkaline phosphatase synthesis response regulator PhoP